MSKKMQLSWFQVIFFISAFFYVAASQDEYEDMGGVPYFSGSSLGEYPIGPIHRARRAQDVSDQSSGDREVDLSPSGIPEVRYSGQEPGRGETAAGDFQGGGEIKLTRENEIGVGGFPEKAGRLEKKSDGSFLDRYVKDSDALQKLMEESSALGNEVRTLFQRVNEREQQLLKEMKGLKETLNGAVVALKNSLFAENRPVADKASQGNGGGGGAGRQRREYANVPWRPYRACVSIEPVEDDSMSMNYNHNGQQVGQHRHLEQPPTVQEYMPPLGNSRGDGGGHGQAQGRYYPQVSLHSPSQQASYQPPPGQPSRYSQQQGSPPPGPPGRYAPQGQPPARHGQQGQAPQYSPPSAGHGPQGRPSAPPGRPQGPPPMPPARPGPQPPLAAPPTQNPPPPGQAPLPQQPGRTPPPSPHPRGPSPPGHPYNPGDIDLSHVYWLRLDPKREQEGLRTKVDNLLVDKQQTGKDVLVIPISHQFQNTDEVKDGFLRAVKVKPEMAKNFRQLRSLNILEL